MLAPKKIKLSFDESEAVSNCEKLIIIQNELCAQLETLKFKAPVEYVYNPLKYAKALHNAFLTKYFENSTKKILFLGMNPGPWGMCQTGIVFGEVNIVKEWFKINGAIEKPDKEHSKKLVKGLECHRSEMSGKKFWVFFKGISETPEIFFKHSFIYNLCPLAFLDVSGKNITPPEIKDVETRKLLNAFCEEAFIKIVKEFKFEIIIGIGKFAEKNALLALKKNGVENIKTYYIPHPSPRNAKNSLNWNQATLEILEKNNLLKYFNEKEDTKNDEKFGEKC